MPTSVAAFMASETLNALPKDGTIISGAPKAESASNVVLLLPDGKEFTIAKDQIASQTPAVSAMPPMGAILKPAELRDVVEYLFSVK